MDGAGLLAVAGDLRLELVDAGELAVAAQSTGEGDAHPLAVEIAAALEQVHLEQQRAAVEGRACWPKLATAGSQVAAAPRRSPAVTA